jgi:hypothetical protein
VHLTCADSEERGKRAKRKKNGMERQRDSNAEWRVCGGGEAYQIGIGAGRRWSVDEHARSQCGRVSPCRKGEQSAASNSEGKSSKAGETRSDTDDGWHPGVSDGLRTHLDTVGDRGVQVDKREEDG